MKKPITSTTLPADIKYVTLTITASGDNVESPPGKPSVIKSFYVSLWERVGSGNPDIRISEEVASDQTDPDGNPMRIMRVNVSDIKSKSRRGSRRSQFYLHFVAVADGWGIWEDIDIDDLNNDKIIPISLKHKKPE